jgi:hypothetical protein
VVLGQVVASWLASASRRVFTSLVEAAIEWGSAELVLGRYDERDRSLRMAGPQTVLGQRPIVNRPKAKCALSHFVAKRHQEFESPLVRQERRSKSSVTKTNTPLNALFRGVFRLYLLTSQPRKCHFWPIFASYGPFLSKPRDFAILAQNF